MCNLQSAITAHAYLFVLTFDPCYYSTAKARPAMTQTNESLALQVPKSGHKATRVSHCSGMDSGNPRLIVPIVPGWTAAFLEQSYVFTALMQRGRTCG
jgi:hypothetical protein